MIDLVTCQRDSHENAKEFIMTSPHVMSHPIILRIANTNSKYECEHVTRPKNEHDCCKTFTSQQNIMTHHNMSQICHMRHICMQGDQIIKK